MVMNHGGWPRVMRPNMIPFNKCLRRLLKIYWPIPVSNEEVRRRANTETISELVRKRRWTWIGHVLRMDNSCLPRIALTWAPEGKRKRGRPKETWRRTVEKERMALGFNSWVEAGLAAANRVSWRSMISGPILHTERRNWWWWWWCWSFPPDRWLFLSYYLAISQLCFLLYSSGNV